MTDAPRDTRQKFEWRSHVSIINFDKSSIWKIDLYTVVNKWFKKKKTNMSLKQSPSISVFRFCRWYYLPPVVCRRAHVLFMLFVFVPLYLQLFVGGLMSYLCYMCFFAYRGVHHILRSVFVLFVFVLCILCCPFLWILHVWLPLRYSLTFLF